LFCTDYSALAPAATGETVLSFNGVPAGRYALSMFHDENGDYQPQIPPEGYAFGNGAGYPPAFEAASIVVEGDTAAQAAMTYLTAGQFGSDAAGSSGVPPPDGVVKVKVDVRESGLHGAFYRPATQDLVPAIILLGGSEGGIDMISAMAPAFAREAYGVLALAYWREVGLPQTLEEIPLEYFDAAVTWLQAQSGVETDAIGVMGWSRGSEAALLLGARNPMIKAVGAIAPSGVVWQGLDFADPMNMGPAWTADGKPLPFMTPDETLYVPGAPMKPMFESAMAQANAHMEAEIPVERINGPVLLISGGADAMWPAADFAQRIVARLERAGFAHGVENLVYPDAGHAVFVSAPDSIFARSFGAPNPMMGGSAAANAAAWADNWPRTLAFFDAALKGNGK
jgi:hypothetical protein